MSKFWTYYDPHARREKDQTNRFRRVEDAGRNVRAHQEISLHSSLIDEAHQRSRMGSFACRRPSKGHEVVEANDQRARDLLSSGSSARRIDMLALSIDQKKQLHREKRWNDYVARESQKQELD